MNLSSNQRIRGIDLARALALLGMMAAHFGAHDGVNGSFLEMLGGITHGRSAILFALLAGISIALMTGRTSTLEGESVPQARTKLVVRAMFILMIGSGLQTYGSGIDIILPTYALLFVVAIPFIRASRKTLIIWSAVFAVVGSAIFFIAQPYSFSSTFPVPFREVLSNTNYAPLPWVAIVLAGMAIGRTDFSGLKRVATIGGIGAVLAASAYGISYLATPDYQAQDYADPSAAISDMADATSIDDIPIADPAESSAPAADSTKATATATSDGSDNTTGSAGSTDSAISDDPYANEQELDQFFTPATEESDDTFLVNGNLASGIDMSGLECTDIGYVTGEVIDRYVNCFNPLTQGGFDGGYEDDGDAYGDPESGNAFTQFFDTVSDSMSTYLIADEHSGSVTEIVGSIGVAMMVVSLCLLVCRRFSGIFYPLVALGSMPLTIYTLHVLTFKHLFTYSEGFAWLQWSASVVVAAIFAMVWKRFFKRGPLESVMAWLISKFMSVPPARHLADASQSENPTSPNPESTTPPQPESTTPLGDTTLLEPSQVEDPRPHP